jgi:hypothetical protein
MDFDGSRIPEDELTGSELASSSPAEPALSPAKFRDRVLTAKGEQRAWVSLKRLRTLWFNTATLCNLTCRSWGILGVSPDAVMCASSRMVVKRKGAPHAVVVACTLLPYDPQFELGRSLREAGGAVPLNHPHCARFCVLGGGSCSAGAGARPSPA